MAKYKHLPPTETTPSLPISITSYHPLPISHQKKRRSSPPPASKALVHRNTRSLQRLGRQLLILVTDQVRGGRELVAGHLLLSWGKTVGKSPRNNRQKPGHWVMFIHFHRQTWENFTTGSHVTPCWFHGRIMAGPVHQVAHIEDADLGVGHT